MLNLPLLAAGFLMHLAMVLFIVCAVALVLVILIQKGRGGGLSGALTGGAMGGVLGTKTGDFLTWVTVLMACVFLGLAVLMAKYYKPTISQSPAQETTAPAAADSNNPGN